MAAGAGATLDFRGDPLKFGVGGQRGSGVAVGFVLAGGGLASVFLNHGFAYFSGHFFPFCEALAVFWQVKGLAVGGGRLGSARKEEEHVGYLSKMGAMPGHGHRRRNTDFSMPGCVFWHGSVKYRPLVVLVLVLILDAGGR